MTIIEALVLIGFLSGAWPVFRMWQGSAGTTLRPTVGWAIAAWALWLTLLLLTLLEQASSRVLWQYLALSLTSCVGVAVFGARRPGEHAWNFVVISLLAVLLLPVAEGWGKPRLAPAYLVFLAAILFVGISNYLPTRGAFAALLIALACAGLFRGLLAASVRDQWGAWLDQGAALLMTCGLWAGWASYRNSQSVPMDVNRRWLEFRDRYGVVWGQRAREQFNRAAENQKLEAHLAWYGVTDLSPEAMGDADRLLEAILKRFFTHGEIVEESSP